MSETNFMEPAGHADGTIPEALKEKLHLCEAVCKELEALSVSSENYGVIHYDFEPDNVFYDADEDVFCVIDFDDAIRCWYSLDIVRALDALDEVVEENLLKEAEQCFLEGYKSVTELTKEQQQEKCLNLLKMKA